MSINLDMARDLYLADCSSEEYCNRISSWNRLSKDIKLKYYNKAISKRIAEKVLKDIEEFKRTQTYGMSVFLANDFEHITTNISKILSCIGDTLCELNINYHYDRSNCDVVYYNIRHSNTTTQSNNIKNKIRNRVLTNVNGKVVFSDFNDITNDNVFIKKTVISIFNEMGIDYILNDDSLISLRKSLIGTINIDDTEHIKKINARLSLYTDDIHKGKITLIWITSFYNIVRNDKLICDQIELFLRSINVEYNAVEYGYEITSKKLEGNSYLDQVISKGGIVSIYKLKGKYVVDVGYNGTNIQIKKDDDNIESLVKSINNMILPLEDTPFE